MTYAPTGVMAMQRPRLSHSSLVWLIALGVMVVAVPYTYSVGRGAPLWFAATASGVCLAGFLHAYLRHRDMRGPSLVVLILSIAFGITWLSASPGYHIKSFGWGDAPFDSDAWKSDKDARAPMVRDLLRTRMLMGRTPEQVRQLLGRPNSILPERDAESVQGWWAYPFHWSFPSTNKIVVYFDENGRVDNVFLYADD